MIAGNLVRPIGVAFSIEDDGTLNPNEPSPERPTAPIRRSRQLEGAKYETNSDAPSAVRRRKLTYYDEMSVSG
jgi:hypothetical protein